MEAHVGKTKTHLTYINKIDKKKKRKRGYKFDRDNGKFKMIGLITKLSLYL